MAAAPVIQVLEKDDYTKQYLVTLANDPLPFLQPNQIRLQSKILGLTTNNFSYARLGHLMGWYDIHPIPFNTPAPYNDISKYGRISAWGYANIIESNHPKVPAGKTVYGYLPIGTLPVDVTIEMFEDHNDQFIVLDEYRQHLWKIYNRYQICDPLPSLIQSKGLDSLAWDSIMQCLFGTSYNMNRYGWAWDPKLLIRPDGQGSISPEIESNVSESWTLEDADLRNAAVVLLSASGKTGMSFAYSLKHERPEDQRPKIVIGVGSKNSRDLTKKSGFYDSVALYDGIEEVKKIIQESRSKKAVLLDFGAREGITPRWKEALEEFSIPLRFVQCGGEVKSMTREQAVARLQDMGKRLIVNASKLREKGIETEPRYFEEFFKAWESFKAAGAISGVKIQWGKGLQEWGSAWEQLCNDEVGADIGLAFEL